MSHYITKIHIDQVRHLQNVDIDLNPDKRTHLILTGKNGSGKTSLLNAIKANLLSISNGERRRIIEDYPQNIKTLNRLAQLPGTTNNQAQNYIKQKEKLEQLIYQEKAGIRLFFNTEENIELSYQNGEFITACFAADRLTKITIPHGVEDIKLQNAYSVEHRPVSELIKYMVHLKTQQAYAQNAGDEQIEKRIEEWFKQFEGAIRTLMNDDSISLEYDYRNYNFLIHQEGRKPYHFNELSDGFSAAIYILADILMRMDRNWLMRNTELDKSMEGVVLIDEVETHLHLELQRSILPFLTEMFPNIQFIVTTHSPFVVNSLENAVIYDLENKTLVKNGLTDVTYVGVVEGYFRADSLSAVLRQKFDRYKELVQKSSLTDDDYEEIMALEQYLDEIPDYLAIGISEEYKRLKLEFQRREEAK